MGKKYVIIILLIAFFAITVIFLYLLIVRGDSYVADDYDWVLLLNDPKRTYSILCNGGSYWLSYDPPDIKSNTSAVMIASTPTNLEQFCSKNVIIKATGREYRDHPLCSFILKKNNPTFCNAKIPVVYILEIKLKSM